MRPLLQDEIGLRRRHEDSLLFNALETAGTIVRATAKQQHVPPQLLGRVSSLDWLAAPSAGAATDHTVGLAPAALVSAAEPGRA